MFQEWLAEILRRSTFLGWVAEHVEGDSRNLAAMFIHNSVYPAIVCSLVRLVVVVSWLIIR